MFCIKCKNACASNNENDEGNMSQKPPEDKTPDQRNVLTSPSAPLHPELCVKIRHLTRGMC